MRQRRQPTCVRKQKTDIVIEIAFNIDATIVGGKIFEIIRIVWLQLGLRAGAHTGMAARL